MDILDVVTQRAGIDPEIVYQLREEMGGQTHYIRSARMDRHTRIRQLALSTKLAAQRYQVTPRTVANIRRSLPGTA